MTPSKPPSGRTIVIELLKEMEARLYPLLYRTLPPAVYHVYVHPDDYREIEAIVPLIVADAQQGLNARVDELNNRARWSTLVSGKQAPIEAPPAGWEVHIHPEPNGELGPGEIGIESRLSVPPPPRFDGGTPTTRIARTVVTGTIRRAVAPGSSGDGGKSTTWSEATSLRKGAPGTAPAAVATASDPAETATALQPSQAPTEPSAHGGTARLAYVDEAGAHVFVMRKDLISVGRGGSAHWVDVQVVSTPRVSREHCRIRRTPDGRFFLQDVSTWGTSIDGQAVEPFARQAEGRVEQTGNEHELKSRARIQLADAVVIDFTVER